MDVKEAITQLTGLKKYCEGMAECDESGSYVFDLDVQALDMAITALSPPNEPLTIEQLREMDEPVWVACKPIEGGNGYWCLCQHGHIITPAGSIYDVKEIPHWVFYRRPLEGAEDGNV